MPIRPLSLAEASPDQRRAYATNFLQLDTSVEDSDDTILAKINAAQPGVQQIFVNEPDTPADVAAGETVGEVELAREEATGKQAGSLGRGDPRAVIHIPIIDSDDGVGARDVLVGVNGRAWQLKRGYDLSVPWRVVAALQNAISNIVRHSQEEGHEGEVIERKASRFAFHFVEKPSDAELRAWDERIGAEFCA